MFKLLVTRLEIVEHAAGGVFVRQIVESGRKTRLVLADQERSTPGVGVATLKDSAKHSCTQFLG